MEHKIYSIKQLEDTLKLIAPGDSILIPLDVYPLAKYSIRSHATTIKCTDHYYEMPNCFPDPKSTGVEIIFRQRKKELNELTYRDFQGSWLRQDTKAVYNILRYNGTAALWNRTKVFDFDVWQPAKGTHLKFNDLQFKLISYSENAFSIQVNDKVVTFEKITLQ